MQLNRGELWEKELKAKGTEPGIRLVESIENLRLRYVNKAVPTWGPRFC